MTSTTFHRLATILAGFVVAGLLLGAGPAPTQSSPPTHPLPPVSSNGKDWTAPNGPGK